MEDNPGEPASKLSEILTHYTTHIVVKFLTSTYHCNLPTFPPRPSSLLLESNTTDNPGIAAEKNMKNPRTQTHTSFKFKFWIWWSPWQSLVPAHSCLTVLPLARLQQPHRQEREQSKGVKDTAQVASTLLNISQLSHFSITTHDNKRTSDRTAV